LVLRQFAVLPEFSDCIGKMIHKRVVNRLQLFLDFRVQFFIQFSQYDIREHLLPYIGQLTDYLIFLGQYFKYLHQLRLENPHGPIPRCSVSFVNDDSEISPICPRMRFFELLFKWGQIGLNSEKTSGFSEKECKFLRMFGHVSRVALSYLVSLGPLFDNSRIFTLDFVSAASSIAKQRPSFLKHLLSHHFVLFFDEYFDAALTSPLDVGCTFLNAISSQFLLAATKDSLVYSHDTFLKNLTSLRTQRLSSDESNFVQFLYLRTGKLLVLALLFLVYPVIQIRQNSMRMLAQVAPVLLMLHHNGDVFRTKGLMLALRDHVAMLNTNIDSIRIANGIEFSKQLGDYFQFCAEQFLATVFDLVPRISNTRRHCTRLDLINLAAPWMTNIHFDLAKRVVVTNPSPHFIIFSPTGFVMRLCNCLTVMSEFVTPLDFWRHLTLDNSSFRDNIGFLVVAVIDYATTQIDHRAFSLSVLTCLYRIDSTAVVSSVVPLLSVANWYFRHIQLGKFEEIEDMSSFIRNVGKNAFRFLPQSNLDLAYRVSTDFSLDAVRLFAEEEMMQLLSELPIILAYCTTHIRQRKSMDVLRALVFVIRNSFDSGVPEDLFQGCDFLAKIEAVNYEQLEFVRESTSSPLRALQDHKVSLTDLVTLLIKFVDYLQADCRDLLAKNLLMWGVACGDMKTATTALDLYAVVLSKESDPQVPLLVIENVCFLLRCISESQWIDETIDNSCVYINAALRVINKLVSLGFPREVGASASWLAVSLLTLEGLILERLLVEILNLVICLIENREFVLPSFPVDFEEIYLKVSAYLNNPIILSKFTVALLSLPPNGDLRMYLIGYLPALIAPIRKEIVAPVIKCLSDEFTRTNRSPIAQALWNFMAASPSNIIRFLTTLFSRFEDTELLINAASFFSTLLPSSRTIDRKRSLFELATAILAVSQAPEVYIRLNAILVQATLEQTSDLFSLSTNLVVTAFAGGVTADVLVFDPDPDAPHSSRSAVSADQFAAIQAHFCRGLHARFRAGGVVRIAPEPGTFPPLFPFEIAFFESNAIREVANLCRRAQIEPLTGWADAHYRAHDPCDLLGAEGRPLRLNFNIPIQKLMAEILGEVMNDNEEEQGSDDEASVRVAPAEVAAEREEDLTTMAPVRAEWFLPSWGVCNAVVGRAATGRVLSLPDPG
jgi:hypothetical protein